ncbi:aldo/keto reductase [Pontibacter silvestris]|uniref:Aldo/keto reductase n=1 Tax=Pontibacter silvestris TaxID=2305183 RepID=A0ABW4X2E9_9BACT|nr:aldo/keto reductase [Pontibacter silvestris]MCC9136060.1 aldo/keto reductase [Pontibacter silvestris]
MTTRRNFISTGIKGAAVAGLAPIIPAFGASADYSNGEKMLGTQTKGKSSGAYQFQPSQPFGLGGVAIGNAFRPTTDEQAQEAMEGAWAAGVRYFDTSPWYGLGLSERRFGHFLHNKKREEYVLSTKVGRLLKPTKDIPETMWQEPSPFTYEYDYSAAGVRRSIEDSLQRLGIESIDIVFIHDLSPDNEDMGENWTEYFKIARSGAMPELTRMREEGLIKAWGLGVNTIDPILRTLEVADPDIFLSATQYSLMYHEDALNRLFPACDKHDVSIIVGAPLNSGFLAGIDRYDYSEKIPEGYKEKRARMTKIAQKHGIDLRTAALQFSGAPATVSAVIPGTRYAKQAKANVESMNVKIPANFWIELKEQKLIAANAPVPK